MPGRAQLRLAYSPYHELRSSNQSKVKSPYKSVSRRIKASSKPGSCQKSSLETCAVGRKLSPNQGQERETEVENWVDASIVMTQGTDAGAWAFKLPHGAGVPLLLVLMTPD